MATKERALSISARELSGMIDKAVNNASKRLGVTPEPGNVIHKWDLIGRVVKDGASASRFSDAVAAELKKGGLKVDPVTIQFKKIIIAGFVERARVATPLQLL